MRLQFSQNPQGEIKNYFTLGQTYLYKDAKL